MACHSLTVPRRTAADFSCALIVRKLESRRAEEIPDKSGQAIPVVGRRLFSDKTGEPRAVLSQDLNFSATSGENLDHRTKAPATHFSG